MNLRCCFLIIAELTFIIDIKINMDRKLQQLTDKIYQEGIKKAEEEAADIIEKAKEEANKILSNARQNADTILSEAESQAADLKSSALSELKMAAQKATEALKQEIKDLIAGGIVNPTVKDALDDVPFLQRAIESILVNWASQPGQSTKMEILIPAETEKALTEYFTHSTRMMMEKGFQIKSVNQIKTGFQVAPSDGTYKISFQEKDFINFFKAFVRPKLQKLLFDKETSTS